MRKRKSIQDVFTARDQIMDEIDEIASKLPAGLRLTFLAEIHTDVGNRFDDPVGYYGGRGIR